MSFKKDQKHIYAHEHNCSIIIITLEGIEKIKTEKTTTKQSGRSRERVRELPCTAEISNNVFLQYNMKDKMLHKTVASILPLKAECYPLIQFHKLQQEICIDATIIQRRQVNRRVNYI